MAFIEDITKADMYGTGRIPKQVNVNREAFPIVAPVTVAEAKDMLRIDETDHDTLLGNLIDAATVLLEDSYGLAFLASSYRQTQNWAGRRERILRYPLLSVSSVKYIATDSADTEVTVDPSLYSVLTRSQEVYARSVWPTHRNYQSFLIYFKAGFGDAGTDANDTNAIAAARALVPDTIKTAVINLAGHMYENPEGQGPEVKYETQMKSYGDLPLMVQRLMYPYLRKSGIF